MSIMLWLAFIALGIPTTVVLSYPLHARLALRRSVRHRPADSGTPVAVIIPVKGTDEGRAQVLRRLMRQRTEGSIEWVFCVENEDDAAVPDLRELVAANPHRVRLLITGPSGGRLGKLHNLIVGVAATQAAHLVFVDADTILPQDRFISEFSVHLEDPGVGLVTCWPAYRKTSGVAGALLAGSINHDLLGHFSLQSIWGGLRLANGSCMAIRRDVLSGIGGLVPQESSVLMDVILARRVHKAGYQVMMHHQPVEVPCRTVTYRVWWNQVHRWQVGMACVLSGAFYAWYCWMRSAFPAALLLALFATGPLMTLGLISSMARISVMLAMSRIFCDRIQLRYVWLSPIVDVVAAIGCWYALAEKRVEWRGRVYRVLAGGVTRRLA